MPVVRGKLLTYDSATGKGLVSANGERIDFEIASWKADNAPNIGMTIEVHTAEGSLPIFVPVNEADIIKEKLGELGGKFSKEGSVAAQNIVSRVGIHVLIAYALFVFGALVFNCVVAGIFGGTIYDIAGLASGFMQLLLILSFATVAVPIFVNHQRSWLAYAAPLFVLLVLFLKIYLFGRQAASFFGSLGLTNGSDFGVPFAEKIKMVFDFLGAGFYMSTLSAAYLALVGAKNYIVNKPR